MINGKQTSYTVGRLRQALKKVLETEHGERAVCSTIADKQLLQLARAHEKDGLGVEIMSYVNSCVEHFVGGNLLISRINGSALDNIASNEMFANAEPKKYYDYSMTGRINKVDGLYKYSVSMHDRPVQQWILCLEVDGNSKVSELFSCAMKMWQAVDWNRGYSANSPTFTLRTNLAHMDTSNFRDIGAFMAELFPDGISQRQNVTASKTKTNDNVTENEAPYTGALTQKRTVEIELEVALYILRTYAHAHVYFVFEMLRYMCGEGELYEELNNSIFTQTNDSKAKSTTTIKQQDSTLYDIHCFLGSFSINPPLTVGIQDMCKSPFVSDQPQGNNISFSKAERDDQHKRHPVCTVPHCIDTLSPLWVNWSAAVHQTGLRLPDYLHDMPITCLCVQRVNMRYALHQLKKTIQYKPATGFAGFTGPPEYSFFGTSPETALLFNGVWYVQDIVDYMLFLKKYMNSKNEILTWQNFDTNSSRNGMQRDRDTGAQQNWISSFEASSTELQTYQILTQNAYFLQRFNVLRGNSKKKPQDAKACDELWKKQFYPPENTTSKQSLTEYGMYYVIQGVADEMLNATYSMLCSDLTDVATEKTSRISWNILGANNSINIGAVFKKIRLLRRDVERSLNNRTHFTLDKSWQQCKDTMHAFPHCSRAESLMAGVLRSLDRTLPIIDEDFALYVAQQNIPGAYLFLRMIRVSNYISARDLWQQLTDNEGLRKEFNLKLAMFPVSIQSDIRVFFDTLQNDDSMLAVKMAAMLIKLNNNTDLSKSWWLHTQNKSRRTHEHDIVYHVLRSLIAGQDKYELEDGNINTSHITIVANTHDFMHLINTTGLHGTLQDLRTKLWQQLSTSQGTSNSAATYSRNVQIIKASIAHFMHNLSLCQDQSEFNTKIAKITQLTDNASIKDCIQLLSGFYEIGSQVQNIQDAGSLITSQQNDVQKAKILLDHLLDIFPLHVYENFIGVLLSQILLLREIYDEKIDAQNVSHLNKIKYETIKPATFGFWYEGRWMLAIVHVHYYYTAESHEDDDGDEFYDEDDKFSECIKIEMKIIDDRLMLVDTHELFDQVLTQCPHYENIQTLAGCATQYDSTFALQINNNITIYVLNGGEKPQRYSHNFPTVDFQTHIVRQMIALFDTGDRPIIHDQSQRPNNIVLSFVLTQHTETQRNYTTHYILDYNLKSLNMKSWQRNSMFTVLPLFTQNNYFMSVEQETSGSLCICKRMGYGSQISSQIQKIQCGVPHSTILDATIDALRQSNVRASTVYGIAEDYIDMQFPCGWRFVVNWKSGTSGAGTGAATLHVAQPPSVALTKDVARVAISPQKHWLIEYRSNGRYFIEMLAFQTLAVTAENSKAYSRELAMHVQYAKHHAVMKQHKTENTCWHDANIAFGMIFNAEPRNRQRNELEFELQMHNSSADIALHDNDDDKPKVHVDEYELDMTASTDALYAYLCFSEAGPTVTFTRPFINAVIHAERNAIKAHVMQFAYSSWLQMHSSAHCLRFGHRIPLTIGDYNIAQYDNFRIPIMHMPQEPESKASWLDELEDVHARASISADTFRGAFLDLHSLEQYDSVVAFPSILTLFMSEKWLWELALLRVVRKWRKTTRKYTEKLPKSAGSTTPVDLHQHLATTLFWPQVLGSQQREEKATPTEDGVAYSQYIHDGVSYHADDDSHVRWTPVEPNCRQWGLHLYQTQHTTQYTEPRSTAQHARHGSNQTNMRTYDCAVLLLFAERVRIERAFVTAEVDAGQHPFQKWKREFQARKEQKATHKRFASKIMPIFGDILAQVLHLRWRYFFFVKTMLSSFVHDTNRSNLRNVLEEVDTDSLDKKSISQSKRAEAIALDWWYCSQHRKAMTSMLEHTAQEGVNILDQLRQSIAMSTATHMLWKRLLIKHAHQQRLHKQCHDFAHEQRFFVEQVNKWSALKQSLLGQTRGREELRQIVNDRQKKELEKLRILQDKETTSTYLKYCMTTLNAVMVTTFNARSESTTHAIRDGMEFHQRLSPHI